MEFLILIAIWTAVLVPSWIQSRRETAPDRSMVTFRRRLSNLERTAPHYEAYSDDMYLDASDVDRTDEGTGGAHVEDVEAAGVSRAAQTSVSQFRPRAQAVVETPVVPTQRAGSRSALQRRRQVFFGLALTWVVSLAAAAITGSLTVLAANGVASLLFFTYVALLVLHHKRALEHTAKVRYLAPTREPRPAVVVLRSGVAR